MQELTVIGIEGDALLVASDDGERFRINIDSVLHSGIRQKRAETHNNHRLSPREIQAHIRAGLTAEQVSQKTGASLEFVERFEAPIVAERDHIVKTALSIPVQTNNSDPGETSNFFGTVIHERLIALNASNPRWTSWKEPEIEWIIKLEFTVDDINHDAKWSFSFKKNSLTPLNTEAITLSRQGDPPTELIPRLRPVKACETDTSRFDSGAFTMEIIDDTHIPETVRLEPIPFTPPSSVNTPTITAINRAADEPANVENQTADLLEALRRRRGERSITAPTDEQLASSIHRALNQPPLEPVDNNETVPLTPAPFPVLSSASSASSTPPPPSVSSPIPSPSSPTRASSGQKASRKGRASMPSWDEIVFGARTDNDPA